MKLHQVFALLTATLFMTLVPGAFSATANGPTTRDVRFMRTAAQGLIFEVEAGQLAATKSTNQQVLEFAQQMVNDHTADLAALQELATRKGVTLPTTTSTRLQRELTRLAQLSGAQFDREYIRFEIGDHRISLREYTSEVLLGFDFEVREFAAVRVPILLAHLRLAYEIAVSIGLITKVPGAPVQTEQLQIAF